MHRICLECWEVAVALFPNIEDGGDLRLGRSGSLNNMQLMTYDTLLKSQVMTKHEIAAACEVKEPKESWQRSEDE